MLFSPGTIAISMSRLKLVTITGADERNDIKDLAKLSREFPFVEWAFLFSQTRTGLESRYPSLKWLSETSELQAHKAVHLCGRMARQSLLDFSPYEGVVDALIGNVRRVQINVSDSLARHEPVNWNKLLQWTHFRKQDNPMQLIIQVKRWEDAAGLSSHSDWIRPSIVVPRKCDQNRMTIFNYPRSISMLHDASGGRGIPTESYELPPEGLQLKASKRAQNRSLFGFAGGISPENVESKIQQIMDLGDFDFWIDMESAVRTNDVLDLDKVAQVLSTCKRYIKNDKSL